MTYSERIKEFGALGSIGMNKRQRKNMLIKESIILATISIAIGIILGIGISFISIKFLNILVSKTGPYMTGLKFLLNPNIEFYMIIPFKVILFTIGIIYLITIISCILPIRKINKISLIEAIRNIDTNKIKAKELKTPKTVKLIFGQEGELAYKNIRKDKSKNKTIVISIVISMILFLILNNLFTRYLNMHGENNKLSEEEQPYSMNIYSDKNKNQKEAVNIVEKYLEEKGLLKTFICVQSLFTEHPAIYMISSKENDLTKEIKELSKSEQFSLYQENEKILYNTAIDVVYGKEYKELLEILGIEELKQGECLLIDTITQDTKYGKDIRATNYEKGDVITIREVDSEKLTEYNKSPKKNSQEDEAARKEEEEIMNKIASSIGSALGQSNSSANEKKEVKENTYTLKIAEVIKKEELDKTTILKKMIRNSGCWILVNEDTIKDWGKDLTGSSIRLYLNTNNSAGIDAEIGKIKEELKIMDGEISIFETNDYKWQSESSNKGLIKKIVVYGFMVLVSMFSALNIFITITSSINLRKREFAVLKSIGMNNKKINKMLFLESIFYGLNAIIYGLLISITILYVIYILQIDTAYYGFKLPWGDLAISIIAVYTVIFASTFFAKNKVKNENLVEDIRNENM